MKKKSKTKNGRSKRMTQNMMKKMLPKENTKKITLVGTYQNNKNFGFVVPDDKKLSGDIFVQKKHTLKARNYDKVVVEITKPEFRGRHAEGKIVEVLGNIYNEGVDFKTIVREFELRDVFPDEVIAEAGSLPDKVVVTDKDLEYRKDCRNDFTVTIDGEDAKDLDDAIHIEKLENGNYKLDVHIADVSYYVKSGSQINKEAVKRGTSVYMMNKVIPMLPVELSNGICSLNQGVDRFALSCLMEIDKEGKVVDSDVRKTIINVNERMSYTDVDIILKHIDETYPQLEEINKDEEYVNGVLEKYKYCYDSFKLMNELALILKKRRLENGYLNLDIPETKIFTDDEGNCIGVDKYHTTFANEIIEHFMLTANEVIAEKFFWLDAPFVYRVHEEPDYDKVLETNQFLYSLGYMIKANRDSIKPTAFAKVLEEIKGTEYQRVVSTLLLRTLKVATYDSENKGHFGIASKYYCHFTSPIRRLPDLFIHRIISIYIDNNYNVPEYNLEELKDKAEKIAIGSTDCEKNAVQAEREAEKMKVSEYMESQIGNEFDGIISSVTEFGMFVELENTVEGLVRFDKMGNDYWNYDPMYKRLIGANTGKVYSMGQSVKVRVINASKLLRQVDFEIVSDEKNEKNSINNVDFNFFYL